jgi:hypothetical protein
VLGRPAAELGRRRAALDELAQVLGDQDHLVQADAPLVSRAPARRARLVAGTEDARAEVEAVPTGDGGRHLDLLLAVGAQPAHETLRLDQAQRRPEQERLDAHVDQAVDDLERRARVQRREHEVSGHRGAHADLRRLRVAHFADHDHVRVLAQERAQRGREVHADRMAHLHLVQTLEAVLDRILDRRDVDGGRVDQVEAGVQSRALARARGSGHEDEPVRRARGLEEVLGLPVAEAELLQAGRDRALLEEPDHHLLAVHRGHRAHAQVDAPLAVFHGDRAVLRHALLGDVHLREDLQARDGGQEQRARRGCDLDQFPVDAVAHAHVVLVRLEVDVARALVDRSAQEQVHDAHGLTVLARRGDPMQVEQDLRIVAFVGDRRRGVRGLGRDLAHHVALAEEARDQGFERAQRGGVRAHEEAAAQLHFVQRQEVRRVQAGDVEASAGDRDRSELALVAHRFRDRVGERLADLRDPAQRAERSGLALAAMDADDHRAVGVGARGRIVREIDPRDAEVRRVRFGDRVLGHERAARQRFLERAGLRRDGLRHLGQHVLVDELALHEQAQDQRRVVLLRGDHGFASLGAACGTAPPGAPGTIGAASVGLAGGATGSSSTRRVRSRSRTYSRPR